MLHRLLATVFTIFSVNSYVFTKYCESFVPSLHIEIWFFCSQSFPSFLSFTFSILKFKDKSEECVDKRLTLVSGYRLLHPRTLDSEQEKVHRV